MNQQKLNEVVRLHRLWLKANHKGKRAALREANLREADLCGANLQRANLRDANLEGANLLGVDLRNANLRGANLRWTTLKNADLKNADLRSVNLSGTNLQRANLQRANLHSVNLQCANLRSANLQDTDLQNASLQNASLQNANLQNAKLPDFQKVPLRGSFRAWKKIRHGWNDEYEYKVIEVEIPVDAKRTSVLASNKCRAEAVKVITENINIEHVCYHSSSTIQYKSGEIIEAHEWDDDIRDPCRPGIHFFLTKEEAEDFYL